MATKALLGALGLGQKELATWLDLGQGSISLKLSNKSAWTLEQVDRVAELFGLPTETLIRGEVPLDQLNPAEVRERLSLLTRVTGR